MYGWKKIHIYLIVGFTGLMVSAGANAAVVDPFLDVQQTGSDTGVTISATTFDIDASVLGIVLGGGGFIDFAPDESFILTSTSGVGDLQVGASGSLLDASFDNLMVTDLGFGTGSFSADLTYISGSLKGGLAGGRIEGTYSDGSMLSANVAAKVGAVVPVPAAIWLFGSGIIGLIAVARRKNT